jgi:trehalose 6-phosphate synthase
VTSLHDGMNLVAKEYIAARDDEQGALILSQFTGASRELRDAIIVNPYDVEQMGEAIRSALEMDPEERHNRMVQMRRNVKENNIYRWAGNLITELSEIRVGDNESSIEPSDLLKSPDSTPNLRTVHLSVVPPRTNFGG